MGAAPALPVGMAGPGPGGPARSIETQMEPGAPAASAQPPNEQELIPAGLPADETGLQLGPILERLPVEVDVCVPVREFRVRHLLALEPGHVIESLWHQGNDVPCRRARCNWRGANSRPSRSNWRCG
jgi:flagellar motor switch/type III secretory pathway protein FliN